MNAKMTRWESRLREYLPSVRRVLDVGAHKGMFTKAMMLMYPGSEIVSIEANPDNLASLQSINPQSYQALLSTHSGEKKTFYLPNPDCAHTTGASYYREVTPYYSEDLSISLPTISLDDFFTTHSIHPEFDLVKIDTQGSELDILRGALTLKARHLLLELPILEYNQGAQKIEEILDYLHERNFRMIDIIEFHRVVEGFLLQIDGLFAAKTI
jgi:FkbM family methyltransferase